VSRGQPVNQEIPGRRERLCPITRSTAGSASNPASPPVEGLRASLLAESRREALATLFLRVKGSASSPCRNTNRWPQRRSRGCHHPTLALNDARRAPEARTLRQSSCSPCSLRRSLGRCGNPAAVRSVAQGALATLALHHRTLRQFQLQSLFSPSESRTLRQSSCSPLRRTGSASNPGFTPQDAAAIPAAVLGSAKRWPGRRTRGFS
jgi:hypothetical protein